MQEISEQILKDFQARKNKTQKSKFIALILNEIQKTYPDIKAYVQEGGFPKSRNIVVGDVKTADVIFTAHYDTAPALPFPNVITPRNMLLSILYAVIVIALPIIFIPFIFDILFDLPFLFSFLIRELFIVAVIILMLFGKANKHTSNDNTSGVITLFEIMAAMNEEQRSKAAFVFFDNEETGLFGSKLFSAKYAKDIKDKPVINFDCVSDGDNIMLVHNKKLDKKHIENLKSAFIENGEKKVLFFSSSKAFYPSDQMNFKTGIGVAALKKSKLFGLYMDRIHTNRDTVFDRANIEFLTSCAVKFTDLYR